MERRYLGIVTSLVLIITISIVFLLIRVPNIHGMAQLLRDAEHNWDGKKSVLELIENPVEEPAVSEAAPVIIKDEMQGHQIRLTLPPYVTSQAVSVSEDYLKRVVTITIDGIGAEYFEEYPMRGNANHIMDVTYDNESMVGVIEITLDAILEVKMTSEEEFIYFDFEDPHDKYDYVVVVDAGHGGKVPGATKMGVAEKDIDLGVVLELKKIFDRSSKNIGVYYTRTTDTNPSFDSRVGLANDTRADVFVSVHANSTASGRMSNISGTEVMYKAADPTEESRRFARMCLEHLVTELESKSKGTVVGDEIFIIRMSEAPVALVEVGFMTNQTELNRMCDSEYQAKTAQAIYDAIVEYLYEKPIDENGEK